MLADNRLFSNIHHDGGACSIGTFYHAGLMTPLPEQCTVGIPQHTMDWYFVPEQLFKVREILNELECPQIIIVSHERELESFADNVFHIEKIDGISEVSQVNGK